MSLDRYATYIVAAFVAGAAGEGWCRTGQPQPPRLGGAGAGRLECPSGLGTVGEPGGHPETHGHGGGERPGVERGQAGLGKPIEGPGPGPGAGRGPVGPGQGRCGGGGGLHGVGAK